MRSSFVFSLVLFAAVVFATVCSAPLQAQNSAAASEAATAAGSPLITQPVDEEQLTVLKGNTHPLARPQLDLGTAPASLPMQRMLLVLKRSPEQETALRKLLDDQHDKASPHYHKWLTPEQFGRQFGPSDADMQTITFWLQSHGFQVGSTKGRAVLEFSGSASQVQEAFHTAIHKYIVNGEQHWANASDPSIPTALTGAVGGVLTLHNFLKKPYVHVSEHPIAGKLRPGKKPDLTFSNGTHAMGPQDYAVIYNSPVFSGGVTGAGVTIGIVGRSNLFNGGGDINNFAFNVFNCCGNFNILLNGADPGDLGGGEEAEATLDTTWAGAVAPGARADLVVSATTNTTDGVDLSEVYIIENNFADIMTESFGACEADFTSSDAAGVSALAEQAAAQGITYFVSTGDEGAEGCDDPNFETVATGPVSANLLASTPFNVAVGGTMFNENGKTTYWSATNTNQESALSYIPENVWNESCAASNCPEGNTPNIWAGSGGASMFFAKPSWQSGLPTIPADGARDLPDVSLSAASHDPYLLCLEGSCVPNSQGQFFIYFVWGTSAASPSFAGVAALVEQQTASLGLGTRQGQANYVLYPLAAKQLANNYQCNGSSTTTSPDLAHCIFNDITAGNNAVPGEVNYGLPIAQYQAAAGYDLASGLGSVNIANLVTNWNSVTFNPTTTTLVLNPTSNITHGSPVSVNITVSPSSGAGTPTGDVSLLAENGPVDCFGPTAAADGRPLLSGSAAFSTNVLPGGGPYCVWAHYAGDATYASSTSNTVMVTVNPEPSTTTLTGPFTQDQFGQFTVPFSSASFGSAVFVRADVKGLSGQGNPTGTVTFSTTSGTIPNLTSPSLNSQGTASLISNPFLVSGPTVPFDAGSYTISAAYSSDSSFQASSSTTPVSFTITPGFFGAISSPQFVNISAPGQSGSISMPVTSSTGFSGTINFACPQGLPNEAKCTFTPASIVANGTSTTTTVSILVSTKAPVAMTRPRQRSYFVAQWIAGFGLIFSFVMVGTPKNRCSRWVLLCFMLALIVVVPGCGGSGGSHTPPPPPPDPGTPTGSYNVTVTATSGSMTSSTGFALFVQ